MAILICKAVLVPAEKQSLKKIFVISPIGPAEADGFDPTQTVLDEIIKPAAADAGGYEVPRRADEIHKHGSISAQVVTSIIKADVCVADLTGRNPNVMYEVAIGHAANKPVLLLQQEPGGPPFDFSHERAIHYDLRVDLANAARQELAEQLRDAHQDSVSGVPARTFNPVRELFQQMRTRENASEPEALLMDNVQMLQRQVMMLAERLDATQMLSPRLPDSKRPLAANIIEYAGAELDGIYHLAMLHSDDDPLVQKSMRDLHRAVMEAGMTKRVRFILDRLEEELLSLVAKGTVDTAACSKALVMATAQIRDDKRRRLDKELGAGLDE